MHAAEREQVILSLLRDRGFVAFQELDRRLEASPATLRRDLDRLETEGRITRVRGGARLAEGGAEVARAQLGGVPFHENINLNRTAKEAIGKAAAEMCAVGSSVIIDGGSTTLQMCPHLEGLGLHVLTNSLHIVSALLPHRDTVVSIPGGTVFREQNIVLSAAEDDGVSRYHADQMFVGAAAVGPVGVMQSDVLLVQAERRLLERAERIVLLVDSSKFEGSAPHVLARLDEIHVVITDERVSERAATMVERSGSRLEVAPLA
jgi:DeoR family ulaG and ulaABCDEF operon transcriptional repressor